MSEESFKEAVCRYYKIKESQYDSFVLKRSLFHRVRLVRPFIKLFYPDYLFNERRLVEKVGKATNLREIQEEVDFYQHKYVVNFIMKDALRFRISGMRLMSLANRAFRRASRKHKRSGSLQDPVRS